MNDPEPGDAGSVLMALADAADRYANWIAAQPRTPYNVGRETSWREISKWVRDGQFDPERVADGTDVASTIR